MAVFRSEETLVGLIALAAVPWIIWILVRALRDGRLPIGKGEVLSERPAAFRILFALYAVAAGAMGFIGFDLLLGMTGR
ncbi:MAG TPA: hypothetical protein VN231_06340 [Allosphingosinicella sp.]|nr:hypothetical protein [Allosphingosinicella sp.]